VSLNFWMFCMSHTSRTVVLIFAACGPLRLISVLHLLTHLGGCRHPAAPGLYYGPPLRSYPRGMLWSRSLHFVSPHPFFPLRMQACRPCLPLLVSSSRCRPFGAFTAFACPVSVPIPWGRVVGLLPKWQRGPIVIWECNLSRQGFSMFFFSSPCVLHQPHLPLPSPLPGQSLSDH
jgi:hypothetical protein